ncbi:hypothetical protein CHLRE_03g183950v5 [Chlamydomonas reinhardtii]|uniref:Integrase catalytic domain-containing protein n=1 Tax=Chlamydomonas reinhardtii TaxID=3055 RepID=A0A2K3DXX4_CHLRE|nr:uncharacterized protein CHLRE_03g183950v5 [Chlamydomonas reinhardtii]PNW85386.1 hypothetical protein CHLRE_03g183950v5 [Chlamydomonas reinhardtii]
MGDYSGVMLLEDASNYFAWRRSLLDHLNSRRVPLGEYLFAYAPMTPRTARELADESAAAASLLRMSCSEGVAQQLALAQHAYEAHAYVIQLFRQSAPLKLAQFESERDEFCLREGETIASYFLRASDLRDRIGAVGGSWTDQQVRLKLLAGLPKPRWENICDICYASPGQTLQQLCGYLMQQEFIKNQEQARSGHVGAVNRSGGRAGAAGSAGGGQGGGAASSSAIICHYCEQPGHIRSHCRVRLADVAAGIFRADIRSPPQLKQSGGGGGGGGGGGSGGGGGGGAGGPKGGDSGGGKKRGGRSGGSRGASGGAGTAVSKTAHVLVVRGVEDWAVPDAGSSLIVRTYGAESAGSGVSSGYGTADGGMPSSGVVEGHAGGSSTSTYCYSAAVSGSRSSSTIGSAPPPLGGGCSLINMVRAAFRRLRSGPNSSSAGAGVSSSSSGSAGLASSGGRSSVVCNSGDTVLYPSSSSSVGVVANGSVSGSPSSAAAASGVPVVDSGTFAHITPLRQLLHNFTPRSRVRQVLWGDGHSSPVGGSGTLRMLSGRQRVDVTGVLYVPAAQLSLLSVRRLTASGVKVVFEGETVTLAQGGRNLLSGRLRDGLFPLSVTMLPVALAAPAVAPPAAGGGPAAPPGGGGGAAANGSNTGVHPNPAAALSGRGGTTSSSSLSGSGTMSSSSSIGAAAPSGGGGASSSTSSPAASLGAALRLHRRFGHLGWTALMQMVGGSLVTGLDVDLCALSQAAGSVCSTCIEAKAASLPFPNSSSEPPQPLALAHSDVCGPMPTVGRGGARYFTTLLDAATGLSAVRLLPTRDHAGVALQEMIAQFESHCRDGGKLRILRSDNGGEYHAEQLEQWLRERSTAHQFSAPYTPQQNGVAERLNRTLMERTRALLFEAVLPPSFWPEAVVHACHVRNLSPSTSCSSTPWEAFTGNKPNVADLRIFGCRVYVTKPADSRSKLSPHADIGTYLGLQRSSAASRVLVGGKVVVSRDIEFDEDVRGPASRLAGTPFGVTADASGGGGGSSSAATPSAGADPAPPQAPAAPANGTPPPTTLPAPPQAPAAGPSRPATRSQRPSLTPALGAVSEPPLSTAASAAAGGGGGSSSSAASAAAAAAQLFDSDSDDETPALAPASDDEDSYSSSAAMTAAADTGDPRSYSEATNGPQAAEWRAAMEEEMKAQRAHGTWQLAEPPPGARLLANRWVFKTNVVRVSDEFCLREGETIASYFLRASDLRDRIGAVGGSWTDQQVRLKLLAGLPKPRWENICDICYASPGQTLQQLCGYLMQQEFIKNQEQARSGHVGAVNRSGGRAGAAGSAGGGQGGGAASSSAIICHYCEQPAGHIRSHCRVRLADVAAGIFRADIRSPPQLKQSGGGGGGGGGGGSGGGGGGGAGGPKGGDSGGGKKRGGRSGGSRGASGGAGTAVSKTAHVLVVRGVEDWAVPDAGSSLIVRTYGAESAGSGVSSGYGTADGGMPSSGVVEGHAGGSSTSTYCYSAAVSGSRSSSTIGSAPPPLGGGCSLINMVRAAFRRLRSGPNSSSAGAGVSSSSSGSAGLASSGGRSSVVCNSGDTVLYPSSSSSVGVVANGSVSGSPSSAAAASGVPVVDSGTFAHITPLRQLLHNFTPRSRVRQVLWGDGHSSPVGGSGTLRMLSGRQRVDVTGVLYVPAAQLSLLSVRRLTASGVKVVFEGETVTLAQGGRNLLSGRLRDGLFPLSVTMLPVALAAPAVAPPAAGGGPAAPPGGGGGAAANGSNTGVHPNPAAALSGRGGTTSSSSLSGSGTMSSSSSIGAAAPSGGGGASSSTSSPAASLGAALRLHRRFGHLGWTALMQMVGGSLVTGLDVDLCALSQAAGSVCSTCIEAKAASLPFPNSSSEPPQPLALAHSDVCGPMPTVGRGGARYFTTLLDAATGLSAVRLLPTRDHAGVALQEMIAQFESHCRDGGKLRILRSDNGGEYHAEQLEQWLRERSTAHQFSAPYTPQQNGVAERLNRTLMERTRALLFEAVLPPSFWPEAVVHACHVRNLSPSTSCSSTPWEAFTGNKPNVADLRIFGCRVYVTKPADSRSKLSPHADIGTYLGLQRSSAASRVLVGGKVVVSRDIEFDEDVRGPASRLAGTPFGVTADASGGGGGSSSAATPSAGADPAPPQAPAAPANGTPPPTTLPAPPQAPAAGPSRPATRSQRPSLTPALGAVSEPPLSTAASAAAGGGGGSSSSAASAAAAAAQLFDSDSDDETPALAPASDDEDSYSSSAAMTAAADTGDPRSYSEATNGPQAAEWRAAMEEEMKAQRAHGTWQLAEPPPGARLLANRWVFKTNVEYLFAYAPMTPRTARELADESAAAASLLRMSRSEGVAQQLALAQHAYEAHAYVIQLFRQSAPLKLAQFESERDEFCLREGETIASYFLRASDLRDRIGAVGGSWTDQQVRLKLLAGLPKPRWENICDICYASPGQTLQQLCGYLMQQEFIKNQEQARSGHVGAVNRSGGRAGAAGSAGGGQGGGAASSSAIICHYCEQPGHIRSHCRVRLADVAAGIFRLDGTRRFKARLVVKGFAQRKGLDFDEVFAPTSRYAALRALLAIAVRRHLLLHQMDFKTAFLNGDLDEVLWMQQPQGFETSDSGSDGSGGGGEGASGGSGADSGGAGRLSQRPLACRLLKSVYGLKQAPRCWYRKLSEKLGELGFTPATADPALFVRQDEAGLVYVLVHVDDLLVAAGCPVQLAAVKSAIGACFEVRDLGEASTYLGMQINRDPSTGEILLLQRRYIEELLQRHHMMDAKPRSLPLPPGTRVLAASEQQPALTDGSEYRSLVGALNYLATCTRPDIAYALSLLARHMAAPTKVHFTLAVGVLRYLKHTAAMGLRFRAAAGGGGGGHGGGGGGGGGAGGGGGDGSFLGYCDADWAGDPLTRRSQTALLFSLYGTAVTWCSQRQHTVAASSVEAEYQAAAAATKEALWLRKLAADLGLNGGAVTIRSDSQGAISLARNPISSSPLSKHIDIQHHLVRERVARGEVAVEYCPTEEMVADALTKALSEAKFAFCRAAMGVST